MTGMTAGTGVIIFAIGVLVGWIAGIVVMALEAVAEEADLLRAGEKTPGAVGPASPVTYDECARCHGNDGDCAGCAIVSQESARPFEDAPGTTAWWLRRMN